MGYKQVSPIPVIEGGTNNTGFPNPFGIAYYDGTKLNNIIPGMAGQILQSQGGSPADWVDVTAIGAVVTVDGDSGAATPSSGVIHIVGSGGIITSGSGSTLTIAGSGVLTVDADTGSATPSSGVLHIVGGSGVTTGAMGSTITIAATGTGGIGILVGDTGMASGDSVTITGGSTGLTTNGSGATLTLEGVLNVANGGTGNNSLNSGEILLGNGTDPITSITYSSAPGTNSDIVSRDAQGNTSINNIAYGYNESVAGGTITLDNSSGFLQTINGSGDTTLVLPDATTLNVGDMYQINNNTTGVIDVQDGLLSSVTEMIPGSCVQLLLTSNGSVDGSWDRHWLMPFNAAYGTDGLTIAGLLSSSGPITFSTFTSYGVLGIDSSGIVSDIAASVTTGYVLTSNGNAAVPTFQAISDIGAVIEVDGNSGSATPSSGVLNITGDGTIISTSGSGSTLSITTESVYTLSADTGSATASSNAITVQGDGFVTSTVGSGSSLTINSNAANAINADSGSATASSNAFSIVGGTGITTSATGSTLTIDATGAGFIWINVTSATQQMDVNNGYIANDGATLVTLTLPATAAVGDIVAVQGAGSGLWTIAQNDTQVIHSNLGDTTTGTDGSLSSTSRYDRVTLMCIATDTDWVVNGSVGTLSFV